MTCLHAHFNIPLCNCDARSACIDLYKRRYHLVATEYLFLKNCASIWLGYAWYQRWVVACGIPVKVCAKLPGYAQLRKHPDLAALSALSTISIGTEIQALHCAEQMIRSS